ncbi:PilW family protein [Paraburkholderia sp.]|uniref:PilW family protein n=1 Tax=Paraburkholderia sp. TaxID=1926495 RepID=UPI0023917B76|nr:PilW family protein [Paraburkholderia sp.]MDE1183416.1 PilW family protein [Paraburkholderia sp.]
MTPHRLSRGASTHIASRLASNSGPEFPRLTSGHTLIELAIAVVLGLLVTAGAVSLYRSQRAAFTRAADDVQIREAGLTALTLIGQQIQMAGFAPADATPGATPPTLSGCTAARPSGGDESLSCETLAGRSDGIAVRYIGDTVSTWPSATGQPTDCLGQIVGVGSAAAGAQGVLIVNRYYAKPSASTGEPELYCEGNGKTGSAQPLVEGVERLRFRYWIDGTPGALDASAVTSSQWADVVAVDMCVLVRGAPQARRVRYVDCDGVSTLGTDLRARQTFWRRVAVRNRERSAS